MVTGETSVDSFAAQTFGSTTSDSATRSTSLGSTSRSPIVARTMDAASLERDFTGDMPEWSLSPASLFAVPWLRVVDATLEPRACPTGGPPLASSRSATTAATPDPAAGLVSDRGVAGKKRGLAAVRGVIDRAALFMLARRLVDCGADMGGSLSALSPATSSSSSESEPEYSIVTVAGVRGLNKFWIVERTRPPSVGGVLGERRCGCASPSLPSPCRPVFGDPSPPVDASDNDSCDARDRLSTGDRGPPWRPVRGRLPGLDRMRTRHSVVSSSSPPAVVVDRSDAQGTRTTLWRNALLNTLTNSLVAVQTVAM